MPSSISILLTKSHVHIQRLCGWRGGQRAQRKPESPFCMGAFEWNANWMCPRAGKLRSPFQCHPTSPANPQVGGEGTEDTLTTDWTPSCHTLLCLFGHHFASSNQEEIFPLMLRVWSPQESSWAPSLVRLRNGSRGQQLQQDSQAAGWAFGHRGVFTDRALNSFVGQGFPESFEPSVLRNAVEPLSLGLCSSSVENGLAAGAGVINGGCFLPGSVSFNNNNWNLQ